MAAAIRDGLAARMNQNPVEATAKAGLAVRLAFASGHEDNMKLLAGLVEVVNPPEGTVRLRRDVSPVDAEMAPVRSIVTGRVREGEEH
jgi:hypothetical protein